MELVWVHRPGQLLKDLRDPIPDDPMEPRLCDERVGFFSTTQIDYGLDEQRATETCYVTRWRLEPSDPAAFARGELVDPVQPIVYYIYIDPATPAKWIPYLKQGVEDWQVAFEAAGFSNAVVARDARQSSALNQVLTVDRMKRQDRRSHRDFSNHLPDMLAV
jgi:hypothetical protein